MALKSRTNIYQKYKAFKQVKDNRSMDDICDSSQQGFRLQAQQTFLKDYIKTNPEWSRLILYHGIGSGKTCTSITLAEEYMKMNPKNKVHVILPARLKTNFLDELISPCGMEAYISADDFIKYHDPSTSISAKKKIKTAFSAKIVANYNIISFEKFKQQASQGSLKKWCHDLTKDRLIIIDEVHNLVNVTYNTPVLQDTLSKHKLPIKSKGLNAILFRYLTTHAHPSCKFLLMTATPIFDNIAQLRELALAVNPSAEIASNVELKKVIELMRGYVSYFPGTSENAYPSVSYEVHDIPMTPTQKEETLIVREKDDDDDDKEAFMSKQRQISIACLPGNRSIQDNMKTIISKLQQWAPKVHTLVKNLEKDQGKHVVFSNFIKNGLLVIKEALEAQGWVNYLNTLKGNVEKIPYKTYVMWDGSIKDNDKQTIKSVANCKANIDGNIIKVILGSPSIKEGVSFKHVQHLHMLDPVWNQSAKTQVEGRAIRFCSHVDIKSDDANGLKRHVVVHQYKSVWTPKGEAKSCDEMIYDDIIPRKYKLVKIAEDALKKVAIDYFLFRRLYKDNVKLSPVKLSSANSVLSIDEDFDINKRKKKERKINTCPKARRPNDLGVCSENKELKVNKHGDPCCYAVSKRKQQTDTRQKQQTNTKKAPKVDKEKKEKDCPKANQVRNPVTGRCIDKDSLAKKGVKIVEKKKSP